MALSSLAPSNACKSRDTRAMIGRQMGAKWIRWLLSLLFPTWGAESAESAVLIVVIRLRHSSSLPSSHNTTQPQHELALNYGKVYYTVPEYSVHTQKKNSFLSTTAEPHPRLLSLTNNNTQRPIAIATQVQTALVIGVQQKLFSRSPSPSPSPIHTYPRVSRSRNAHHTTSPSILPSSAPTLERNEYRRYLQRSPISHPVIAWRFSLFAADDNGPRSLGRKCKLRQSSPRWRRLIPIANLHPFAVRGWMSVATALQQSFSAISKTTVSSPHLTSTTSIPTAVLARDPYKQAIPRISRSTHARGP